MGRTPPTPPREVVDVPALLNELRVLTGRIMGIVDILDSDIDGGNDGSKPAS